MMIIFYLLVLMSSLLGAIRVTLFVNELEATMTRKLKSSRAENFIDDIFCVIGFFINLFSKVGKFLASFSKPKALKQEIKARTKFAIFNPKPNHFYEVGLYSDRPRNAKETELGYKPQGRNAKGHFMPKNKNEVVEKSGRIIRFNPK